MEQTKYASVVPKNLGLGLNFWQCSEGYFISGRPESVIVSNGQSQSKKKVNTSQVLLPQHQSTYERGPEYASIDPPPFFRPFKYYVSMFWPFLDPLTHLISRRQDFLAPTLKMRSAFPHRIPAGNIFSWCLQVRVLFVCGHYSRAGIIVKSKKSS